MKAAEEKRLEEERARREEERKQEEYAKVKKQQIMERVKTLTETDVGRKAFKGLTSEVDNILIKYLNFLMSNCFLLQLNSPKSMFFLRHFW